MLYGSFRRALHNLIRQNHIEPGSNVLNDHAMLILIMWMLLNWIIAQWNFLKQFNWIAQWNFVKQFLLVQTIKYLTLYNIFVWSDKQAQRTWMAVVTMWNHTCNTKQECFFSCDYNEIKVKISYETVIRLSAVV